MEPLAIPVTLRDVTYTSNHQLGFSLKIEGVLFLQLPLRELKAAENTHELERTGLTTTNRWVDAHSALCGPRAGISRSVRPETAWSACHRHTGCSLRVLTAECSSSAMFHT